LQISKAAGERVVIEEISPRELPLIYIEFGQFIRHYSPRVALGARLPPRLLARHHDCGHGAARAFSQK
jgi:hypothetical protein